MKPLKRKPVIKFSAHERELVKNLENEINQLYPMIYTEIDTDSKARVFKSGYDILFSLNGKIIFCECKHVKNPPADPEGVLKLLSDFQKLTRLKILKSGSPYWVVVFYGFYNFSRPGNMSHVLLNASECLVNTDNKMLIDYIKNRLKA